MADTNTNRDLQDENGRENMGSERPRQENENNQEEERSTDNENGGEGDTQ